MPSSSTTAASAAAAGVWGITTHDDEDDLVHHASSTSSPSRLGNPSGSGSGSGSGSIRKDDDVEGASMLKTTHNADSSVFNIVSTTSSTSSPENNNDTTTTLWRVVEVEGKEEDVTQKVFVSVFSEVGSRKSSPQRLQF